MNSTVHSFPSRNWQHTASSRWQSSQLFFICNCFLLPSPCWGSLSTTATKTHLCHCLILNVTFTARCLKYSRDSTSRHFEEMLLTGCSEHYVPTWCSYAVKKICKQEVKQCSVCMCVLWKTNVFTGHDRHRCWRCNTPNYASIEHSCKMRLLPSGWHWLITCLITCQSNWQLISGMWLSEHHSHEGLVKTKIQRNVT